MKTAQTLPAHEEQILWASVLGCERKDLYAGRVAAPTPAQMDDFEALALRRLNGEPLQYLTGRQGFRKLDLQVGPGVLVPRPETEMVVERCLQLLADVKEPRMVDIGTGSGAIALAIATERTDSKVWAVDSSEEALKWARKNVARMKVPNARILRGDLFQPLARLPAGSIDLVVSNPPYLSRLELDEAEPAVRDHEPSSATVGGLCGLEVYRRITVESWNWLRPGGWLVLETSQGQWGRLRSLLSARFTDVGIRPDLAGKLRVAEGRKP